MGLKLTGSNLHKSGVTKQITHLTKNSQTTVAVTFFQLAMKA